MARSLSPLGFNRQELPRAISRLSPNNSPAANRKRTASSPTAIANEVLLVAQSKFNAIQSAPAANTVAFTETPAGQSMRVAPQSPAPVKMQHDPRRRTSLPYIQNECAGDFSSLLRQRISASGEDYANAETTLATPASPSARARRGSLPYNLENSHRRSESKLSIARLSYDETASLTTTTSTAKPARRSLASLDCTSLIEEFNALSRPISEPSINAPQMAALQAPLSCSLSNSPQTPRKPASRPTKHAPTTIAANSMNFGTRSSQIYPGIIIVCDDCHCRLVCKQNPAVLKSHRNFPSEHIDSDQLCGVCCGPLLAERTSMYGSDYNAVLQTKQPFWCKRCGSDFSRADRLVAHAATHTGKGAFPCTQCSASFSRKPKLAAHVAEMHKPGCGPHMSAPAALGQFCQSTEDFDCGELLLS